MVRPHGLVSDLSVLVDDVDHVGHRAVKAVHGAVKVVHEHRVLDPILLSTIPRELELLLPGSVETVMFAWVWLADVDGEKLKTLISIVSVEFV